MAGDDNWTRLRDLAECFFREVFFYFPPSPNRGRRECRAPDAPDSRKVGEVIKSTGGTYLARGGKIVALEGEAPKRTTIVVYDSLEKAQASRNSPAWAALSAERNKAIKTRSYVTEGLPN